MKPWKPKEFKPEFPGPMCAFFLGGGSDSEIWERDCYEDFPTFFKRPFITGDGMVKVEDYRRETIRFSDQEVTFYVIEDQSFQGWIIRSLTALHYFRGSLNATTHKESDPK